MGESLGIDSLNISNCPFIADYIDFFCSVFFSLQTFHLGGMDLISSSLTNE